MSKKIKLNFELSIDEIKKLNKIKSIVFILLLILISCQSKETTKVEPISYRTKIINIIKENGLLLEHVPHEYKDDLEIVSYAVKNNGLALKYASVKMRDNREIANFAINNNGLALAFVSSSLSFDKGLVLTAVTHNGMALEYASSSLKGDKEIVDIAINNNGDAIKFSTLIQINSLIKKDNNQIILNPKLNPIVNPVSKKVVKSKTNEGLNKNPDRIDSTTNNNINLTKLNNVGVLLGDYSHINAGWTLTIKNESNLLFYESKGSKPYQGKWEVLSTDTIKISVPGYRIQTIFKISNNNFYIKNKLIWKRIY